MTRVATLHRLARPVLFALFVVLASTVGRAQVSFTILDTTSSADAIGPTLNGLMLASDGDFYGTSSGSAANKGTVFKMTPAGVVTVLHTFSGGASDGDTPKAALLQANDGYLYGTTSAGGAANFGTIFRITTAGVFTLLHSFAGGVSDGRDPEAALIQAADGNLYGTTILGGASNLGTAFRMALDGSGFAIVHSFADGSSDTDGASPLGIFQASNGSFYGWTLHGQYHGSFACCSNAGTVYEMAGTGAVTLLPVYSTPARVYPTDVIQAGSAGNLYVTQDGFQGGVSVFAADGSALAAYGVPASAGSGIPGYSGAGVVNLVQGADASFYGTWRTYAYSTHATAAALFVMSPTGVFAALQTVPGVTYQAVSPLVETTSGTFYGTTATGLIFRLTVTPQAPTITKQPTSQSVMAHKSTTFEAAVTAIPPATFQWQSSADGLSWTNLADGGPYSGATTLRLTVTPPTIGLSGRQFRAVATNSAGAIASSPATLTVHANAPGNIVGSGTTIAVYRPSTGTWYPGLLGPLFQWGLPGDVPVPGDYEGQGLSDYGVWRPSNGTWYIFKTSDGTSTAFHWGLSTDIPVPGDYDGDGKTDYAVYRPSTGIWFVATSSSHYATAVTSALGLSTDIPVPGDYDGDGKTDVAVWRPSAGMWFVRLSSTGTTSLVSQWGLPGDIPVPGDYDGDGKTDLTVWRPWSGIWYIRQSSTSNTTYVSYQWGLQGDVPVPGDYDDDGRGDLAVFRPGEANWFILRSSTNYTSSTVTQYGLPGDIVVPNETVAYAMAAAAGKPTVSSLANLTRASDLDGDGRADLTVYRPSTATWYTARSTSSYTTSASYQWGSAGDSIPVTGDFDGDGVTDIAVYHQVSGTLEILLSGLNFTTSKTISFGVSGNYTPVPGDYDGDGKTDLAVYRNAYGMWYILLSSTNSTTSSSYQWGLPGDVPVPGDYDGDGLTDLAVWRPSTGTWYVRYSSTSYSTWGSMQWGLPADIAVPGDYDGDGKTDFAVWRPAEGNWYIRQSSTNYASYAIYQWGLSGDTPVPSDFDGDGKTDLAVWRPSTATWYLLKSSTGFTSYMALQWGVSDDTPILGRQQ
jgi:uncharacterized repeat protein (TIGR03803 family)